MFALVYILYAIIWLPFPNYLPVTASNMNYCGPVFGVVLIVVVTLWFVRGRDKRDGPDRDVIAFVLKNEYFTHVRVYSEDSFNRISI